MFHNPYDSTVIKIIKHFLFWVSLSCMIYFGLYLLTTDFTLPKRKITVELDIKNKINVCLPEAE